MSRYACLLVACFVLACFGPRPLARFAPLPPKIGNIWKTETGLVQRTKARWKDRPIVSGGFFFDAEFQVWRGRIPEKSSKNTPFPLGGDCL